MEQATAHRQAREFRLDSISNAQFEIAHTISNSIFIYRCLYRVETFDVLACSFRCYGAFTLTVCKLMLPTEKLVKSQLCWQFLDHFRLDRRTNIKKW